MSEKLRFFDPQLKEKPEQELFNEPEWLIHLRQLDGQIRVRRRRSVCSCLLCVLIFIYAKAIQTKAFYFGCIFYIRKFRHYLHSTFIVFELFSVICSHVTNV